MVKPKFFIVEVDEQEMCVTKVELVSLIRRGARFDCIRPVQAFDFTNPNLFYVLEDPSND